MLVVSGISFGLDHGWFQISVTIRITARTFGASFFIPKWTPAVRTGPSKLDLLRMLREGYHRLRLVACKALPMKAIGLDGLGDGV